MDINPESYDISKDDENVEASLRVTKTSELVNKCNQCDHTFPQSSNLRAHLKTHSGEKSNKCKQRDFASSHSSSLRTHLKRHSGEKSSTCNQCGFKSSHLGN